MQRILVLGAGFAGLWSAVGAARKLAEERPPHEPIAILVVDARPFHSIRVRNYEMDLTATQVPLADVFEPIGVKWLQGKVTHIDAAKRKVKVETAAGQETLDYTRLVMALVLLCHKFRFAISSAQQGQRSSRCAMARANR